MQRQQKTGKPGWPYGDKVELEGHKGAPSIVDMETEEEDGVGTLEAILDRDNLNMAYLQVKRNKGAAGVDKMTVDGLKMWLKEHKTELIESIKQGSYKPQPVRKVEIPKPEGGKRQLGIPTVKDRMIQQAIAQILTPIFEKKFSDSSYGFRPGRSCHQAIQKAKEYYKEGYTQVVDIDMAKYFDTVNHDLLMEMLREEIEDKRVLELIKKYLKSGIMVNGLVESTDMGTPQGGPLSPLLSNIYLTKFDRELEKRGHKFVRYADDCNIYVKSRRAAERVMESSRKFLEGKLKLVVNKEKSQVGSPLRLKFLGFSLYKNRNMGIRIHEKAEIRFKQRIREITSRKQSIPFELLLKKLKQYTVGWINYYGIADMKGKVKNYTEWIRRRLRQFLWKQWKKVKTRYENLQKLGIDKRKAWEWANTRKKYWRIAGSFVLTRALTNKRLATMGYDDIELRYKAIHSKY